MRTLVAGPWIGEFGWELFAWQGYLRELKATKYDQVHVICRPGHEYLYEDFASSFEFYTTKSTEVDMWGCRNEPAFNYDNVDKKSDILKPSNFLGKKQRYIQYGTQEQNKKFDLVFHARNTNKCGTGYRDWPLCNWEALRNKFKDLNICSIGTRSAAFHIPGTTDNRDLPLAALADVLTSSKLLVGPSSGPMHFGSLCGIPHLVWWPKTGMKINMKRYEEHWNPFNTKVIFTKDGCDSSVSVIKNTIKENIKI